MAEQSEPPEIDRERESGDETSEAGTSERVSLKGMASLERLRDRVEAAASEMERLREENETLLQRVKKLETRPDVDPRGTFLSLDHDPEELKRKIASFIDAIDSYLEKERSGT
ncbi:MAG: hypothetical protein WD021_00525 [Rhodothermales bacterium]